MREVNYNLQIIDARFVAAGVLTMAKGFAYRLRPDKGGSGREEDYKLGAIPAMKMPEASQQSAVSLAEEAWSGKGDYWLGRSVLTDLVVNVPDEGILVLQEATVNASLQKQIVKTALVGKKGTIKEYISDGDYQLNIAVGLVSVNSQGEVIDQYPERALSQLRRILEIGESLEVSSPFLDALGVNRMVVTGFTVKQMTFANRQLVEITALSDTEYVIENNEY